MYSLKGSGAYESLSTEEKSVWSSVIVNPSDISSYHVMILCHPELQHQRSEITVLKLSKPNFVSPSHSLYSSFNHNVQSYHTNIFIIFKNNFCGN